MAISIIFGVPWSAASTALHQEEADGDGEQRGTGGEDEPEPLGSAELELLVAALGGEDVQHADGTPGDSRAVKLCLC